MRKRWKQNNIKYEIIGLLVIALGVFSMVSLASAAAGVVGQLLADALRTIAGQAAYAIAFFCIIYGLKIMRQRQQASQLQLLGMILLVIVLATLLHLQLSPASAVKQGLAGAGGGILGAFFSWVLLQCFARTGSYLLLATVTVIAMLLITDRSLVNGFGQMRQKLAGLYWTWRERLTQYRSKRQSAKAAKAKAKDTVKAAKQAESMPPVVIKPDKQRVINIPSPLDEGEKDDLKMSPDGNHLQTVKAAKDERKIVPMKAETKQEAAAAQVMEVPPVNCAPEAYQLPPIDLLSKAGSGRGGRSERDIEGMAAVLETTLSSFGVDAHVLKASQGPAITQFEVQPAVGVKVSKIVNLADDLALKLAVPDIRIEAPIPGKAVIGIEVPNKKIQPVHLRGILETIGINPTGSKLNVVLGKDIAGNPVITDIAKAPHLLVAGATGSGKSVCINALIASILYQAKPQEVKFLMVDPKMVELTNYNGIPHLIAPVVTDPKKAAAALKWIVTEMENRYRTFASNGVRDIRRYNELKAAKKGADGAPLPFIVVIIDELADLMMVAPGDVEDAICRLTQMARAAGIHLVIATQRPSVDVITGIIKANIPSRIAFAVSSQVDSRTIIDMNGAEKLLGRGDMLFLPVGASKPVRIQGVYISDDEVEALVEYVKAQCKPEYLGGDFAAAAEQSTAVVDDDPLLTEAIHLVVERGQASVSMLQRKFKLGYNRAARLMDMMEERGIVGPYEGSKPREVLLTPEDLAE